MNRKIIAIVNVDDNIAFDKIDDGPVAYLEKEFGWLEQSGVVLKNCFIADDDESNSWQAYLNYIIDWVFDHLGEEFEGMTPATYFEALSNDFQ